MTVELLRQNWAITIAAVILMIVAAIIIAAIYRRSAGGQLAQVATGASAARIKLSKAHNAIVEAEKRVSKLQSKAVSVKPRILEEAKLTLQDAKALQKIAHDGVLVANNQLRRVIFEEFPPAKHEALRKKYLPDDKPDANPFSF